VAKSRVRAKSKKQKKSSCQTHRTDLGGVPGPHDASQPHALLPDLAGLEWVAGKVQPRKAAPSLRGTSGGRAGPGAGPASGVSATVLERPVAESPAQPPDATPILVADAGPHRALQVMSFGCDALTDADPQGLGLTYWFDAAPEGEPYPVTVRFIGQHTGTTRDQSSTDHTFDVQATVDHVTPGSGRIALTTRVLDLAPGQWQVTATPVSSPPRQSSGASGQPAQQPALPDGSATGTTTFVPVARVRAPGVRLGAWPAFVGVGAVVALITEALLAGHHKLPTLTLLVISFVASLLGIVGAKLYYLAGHREQKNNLLLAGMSIQGFALVAIATILLGSLILGIPVGRMLDVTAPGLLLGMSIGRPGCFFGGCCAGIPTASRWGLWSSDREVGVRRIPVQLIESASSGTIAVTAMLAVLLTYPATGGLIFVAAIAANTFVRQLLFPLREIQRATAHGRALTMAVTGLVMAAALAIALSGN
jgi:phosphatidylglycerol---prolipoprotein diacylglyceryl transferase